MRTIGTPSTQARKLNAIASGALPNGDPVVVNADGTVSAAAETSVSQAYGTAVVFEAGAPNRVSSTFDSSSNKVVIAYADAGNSNYCTAVVGTVDPSDNSITFGSPAVASSNYAEFLGVTFDSNSNKVVICFSDASNSNHGKAVVGTVSGASISFGTEVVFEANTTADMAATFDSNSNKVVIAYKDSANSNKGTAIVGTVSGTSISFGTAVVFEQGTTIQIGATFDTSNNKVVIAYNDLTNSNYGTAVVGTVSGTAISFGTPVVYESAYSAANTAVFDSTNNKIVVIYRDGGNSFYATSVVGTVSGDTISFGTPVVVFAASNIVTSTFDSAGGKVIAFYKDFATPSDAAIKVGTVSGTSISFGSEVVVGTSGGNNYVSATFDSNSNKVVVSYSDASNSNAGTSVVFQSAYTSTNLTAENYIGLSSNGYPDTAGATIDVQGAINDRQSGLTAGQAYYVQTDGTLTTTAGDPSVFAGTAISATKMIVKG
ncbi:hypothetical protein OAF54_02655 [bacterium]|nr:hypothetical protein [bacterium]